MIACKSCGAAIVWAEHHKTGKQMPMQLDESGGWVLISSLAYRADASLLDVDDLASPRYSSHFATCPQANQWRSKK